MKITKDIEYSILILNNLAGRIGPTKVYELTETLGLSFNYAEQIVNKLKWAGLITVKRGPNGGVERASSELIPIKSIYEAFEVDLNADHSTHIGRLKAKFISVLEESYC